MSALKPPNWIALKADYVRGGLMPTVLAKKYRVTVASINKRIQRGKWSEERKEFEDDISRRATQELHDRIDKENVRAESEKLERLLTIGNALADKIEAATQELGEYYEVKRKAKIVEALESDDEYPSVVEETSTEARRGKGQIKASDVKALTSALRDLREVIRVTSLDDQTNSDITVRFGGEDVEEASK